MRNGGKMFWIVLLLGTMALFFMQFGAMAVVVKLLWLGVNVLIVVGGIIGAVYLVRRVRRS